MRMNMNLIRDILLYIEDEVDGSKRNYRDIELLEYSASEINYHFKLLANSGFIETCLPCSGHPIYFRGLTLMGHQYLENIRNKYVWEDLLQRLKDTGLKSLSLDLMDLLARKILKEKLNI